MLEDSDEFYDSDEGSASDELSLESDLEKGTLQKSKNNQEFTKIHQELIGNEKEFIKVLHEVSNTHFYMVYKEMVDHSTLKSVFGDLEYLLDLHNRILKDFERSSTAYEICITFILNEIELKKHIQDQWKTCENEDWHTLRNYLKDIDFYNKSSWIIRTYVNFVRSINNEKFVEQNHRLECTKAFKLLVNIYKQINYIQEGLKLIVGSNIHVRDCGAVMYKDQFETKFHSGMTFMKRYNFDVFITNKYAIFTESKMIDNKPCFEFVDAFLLTQIVLEIDRVGKKISILTGEPKKRKFTLYASNEVKFNAAFKYLRQNYN